MILTRDEAVVVPVEGKKKIRCSIKQNQATRGTVCSKALDAIQLVQALKRRSQNDTSSDDAIVECTNFFVLFFCGKDSKEVIFGGCISPSGDSCL